VHQREALGADEFPRSLAHRAHALWAITISSAEAIVALSAPVDRAGLAAIGSPALVVAGSRDELAGDPQGLADAIPGAKALTLAGCDHFNAIPHGLLKAAVFDFLDGYLDGV
jgi:pimeloyl-ACP methyl ester carboxylesterase